jgi:AraC-like DNA-binding protein
VEAGGTERQIEGHGSYALGPGYGAFAAPGHEIGTALRPSGGSTSTVTLTLPNALVHRAAEFLIGEPVRQPLVITGPVDLRPSSRLGQSIDFLLDQLDRDGGLFDKYPMPAQEFQCGLVGALIEQTANNYQPQIRHHWGGSASRHVAKMEEYIEANVRNPITVGSLAHAVGVSARTLRDCCHRMRDMTPLMIMWKMRLHAAHKRLEKPLPHDTVASVAHEYGFTNVGRFARHYRQEFRGESPIETLQRGRRRLFITLNAPVEKPPGDSH